MALYLLKAKAIAIAPMVIMPIAKMVNAMATIQSNSPVEVAARQQTKVFVLYVAVLVISGLIIAGLTVWLWSAGNKYQTVVKADADARIAEAQKGVSEADAKAAEANLGAAKANEGLAKSNEEIARLTKEAEALRAEAETAKKERAEADKQIAIAKADAARAKEGIANAEAQSAKASVEVARLQVVVANAETKRAQAERALLEMQERLRQRVITAEQRKIFVSLLKSKPKGRVQISCIEGSNEACSLAADFRTLLLEAGWEVAEGNSRSFFKERTPTG